MSEPISVFRVISWLPMGGIERRLVAIMPKLQSRGYKMNLVCTREYGALVGEMRDNGIPVQLIQFNSRFDPGSIWKLRSELIKNKTKVVHSHMYRSSAPATVAAKLARVPAIFSQVHNIDTWQSNRQKFMDKQLSRFRDGVISVSRAVQQDVCTNLGLPESKVPILYNGVDTNEFRPDDVARIRGRKILEVSDDRPVILIPARLHPQKLPLQVLQAFQNVLPKLTCNPLLAYAGPGKMEEELKQAIVDKGLQKQVIVLGRRDDMLDMYNASDLVLLSSQKEGFSNAIIEALACGKPVIAADVGGNKEAISTSEIGWIHDCEDFATLEKQLVEALTDWRKLADRKAKCRERGERFSLDSMVDDTDKLYRSVLEKKGAL